MRGYLIHLLLTTYLRMPEEKVSHVVVVIVCRNVVFEILLHDILWKMVHFLTSVLSLFTWFDYLIKYAGAFTVKKWENKSLVSMAHWTAPWQFEKQSVSSPVCWLWWISATPSSSNSDWCVIDIFYDLACLRKMYLPHGEEGSVECQVKVSTIWDNHVNVEFSEQDTLCIYSDLMM